MIVWRVFALVALAITSCLASISELDNFFKSDDDKKDTDQIAEATQITEDDLTQFMRRSGLLLTQKQGKDSNAVSTDEEDQLSALQSQLVMLHQLRQQQQLEQDQLRQHQQIQQQQLGRLQQEQERQLTSKQQQDRQYTSQQQQDRQYTSQQQPDEQYLAQQQQQQPTKADRQGYYADDGHGYDGHAGYSDVHHRVPQQIGFAKNFQLPILPSVGIKIDPLGILKLLLQLLPRPLLNLNGKIFLGVELGKGVSLGKGVPHAPVHGGKVITIGK